jgi:hypothetical protein
VGASHRHGAGGYILEDGAQASLSTLILCRVCLGVAGQQSSKPTSSNSSKDFVPLFSQCSSPESVLRNTPQGQSTRTADSPYGPAVAHLRTSCEPEPCYVLPMQPGETWSCLDRCRWMRCACDDPPHANTAEPNPTQRRIISLISRRGFRGLKQVTPNWQFCQCAFRVSVAIFP